MPQKQNDRGNPTARFIVTIGLGWALWSWPPGPYSDPLHHWLWYIGAFYAAIGALQTLGSLATSFGTLGKLRRALGEDDSKGSAGFMSEREIRAAKLHKRRPGSRFIGIVGKTALWLWTETSHLILGPAGSWKTTAAIMNYLMGCPESAFITDIKGELWETTRWFREKVFKHRTVKIDPKDPENSVKINPLDPVVAWLESNDPAALTYVRDMALQLSPDPKGGGGGNDVFYKGARSLIVTVIFAVCVVMPPEHRNLATVYRAMSDLDILHDLLEAASKSDALNGEIADAARSAHQMAFGDTGQAKTFESFRINALQALEAFGPGNYLAALTSQTTFKFSELKTHKVSVYVLIDFANSAVLAQFAGLLQWMAVVDIVAAGNNKPVLFILDEFCNAPYHALPKMLTLLRSAGARVVMATQDLDDIVRVYSKHALETVLSETSIKQVLGGIRSKTTLEYFSSYLGEYTEVSTSSALGKDDVQESVSRANRRLLTEDELRRLPDDAQIVIYDSYKPILAKKVQVFAISPWRSKLGINTIYGSARKLLPVEVRTGWFGTRVTSRGARLYQKMEKAVRRKDKAKSQLVREIFARFVPSTGLLVVAALVGLFYAAGLPNLRWEYSYRGSAQATPIHFVRCSYVGPTSPGMINGPHCPLIIWRKTW